MTLWDKRLWPIFGLAFFIFACEEPGEIGLEINPENGAFVAKYDEIAIKSTIIEYEDILSDNSTRTDKSIPPNGGFQSPISAGRLLTGNIITQDFGKLYTKGFTSIYLEPRGFKARSSFVFDSLILRVKIDYLYGEKGKFIGNKRIFIHELEDEIKLDSLYLTKNSTAHSINPLGEFNIDISWVDSTGIDTVFTTRLSDELGQRFLDIAKSDTTMNNLEFRELFNGIAFVSDEANEVLLGIIPESQSTYMELHYHDAVDTLSFAYPLQGWVNDTIVTVTTTDTLLHIYGKNITKYYNNINLDKTGTPIEGIVDFHTDFQTSDGLSYIHGSAGILTKLNMGSYMDYLDTIDHLVINRAEILIPVVSYDNYLKPPGTLDLYVSDQDNKFIKLFSEFDFIYATASSSLVYAQDSVENKGMYVGEITDYIQGLTSGIRSDSLLLLGQTSLWNSVINVNQFITEKDKITLRVYYSTLQ